MRRNLKQYFFVCLMVSVLFLSACAQVDKAKTSQSGAQVESGINDKKIKVKEQKENSLNIDNDTEDDTQEYLKLRFDVDIDDEIVNSDRFLKELSKIADIEGVSINKELNWEELIKISVRLANYEELALSYTDEKIDKRLKKYGLESYFDKDYSRYILTALDVSLINMEQAKSAVDKADLNKDDIRSIFAAIINANGEGRNYLGYSDDKDIYSKIDFAWNSFILFDDGVLNEIGKEAVTQGITTGYGLKSDVYSSNFLPEKTVQYGHSDIKHAHQLIGLLNSEDIRAKVQLEPKISIYQYLLEWGTPPEKTPTYEVKQFGDIYLVYAVEYDLELEFDNIDDMKRFDGIIKDYAKKNEGNEEALGLIYASWWQPLYTVQREDMDEEAYHEIFDCVIENGIYSIHPFTLAKDKDEVAQKLSAVSNGLEVKPVKRYCNTAFYNYMSGKGFE